MLKDMKERFEKLSPEEQQSLGVMVGVTAGLLVRGILLHNARKNQPETIKLVVPKNAEIMIFVKGGK